MSAPIHEQAAALVARYGMHLVEIPRGSKAPVRQNWQTETIHTPEAARAHWLANPTDNMGVVLGLSNLCSIDVDDLENTRIIFSAWGIDIDAYAKLYTSCRGNPARFKVFFSIPEGLKFERHVLSWPDRDKPGKSKVVFELRAGSGQDVLPPSLHPEGYAYEWICKPNGAIKPIPPELLAIFTDWTASKAKAKALCPWAPPPEPVIPRSVVDRPREPGQISVIDAFNDAYDLHAVLIANGYTQQSAKRYLSPHSGTGVTGVSVLPDGRRCWVHHASDPLCSEETGHPVAAFDLYCHYNHGGDAKAAVKQIARDLGLKPQPRPRVQPALTGEVSGLPQTSGVPQMGIAIELGLNMTEKGVPVYSLDNCVRVLEVHNQTRNLIWYDRFLDRVMHRWLRADAAEWKDADDVKMALWMQRAIGIPKVSPQMAHDAVLAMAHADQRNEAEEWITAQEWDGEQRLESLMSYGFGAERNEYTERVGVGFMCGMVNRILKPGCKFDTMLVLEGKQGMYKSTALAVLGGQWFAEMHESVQSKDFFQGIQGKMLLEISEMHAFGRAEVEKIKGIISSQSDRYRASYGRNTSDHPRQCIFAGTTNRSDWQRDETGGRRFWPIACGAIRVEWIREVRPQLFAEARQRLADGEPYWTVPTALAEAEQHARRPEDSWEEKIERYATGRNRTTMSDVMEALGIPTERQDKGMQMRVGGILRLLGWQSRTVRDGEVVSRAWVRTGPNGDDLAP